ncbi:MAG: hypothetical protein GY943_25385, partial [Chloroflexi bacterium]|nr:hypothetical protein [Chloroflexota bacterium]
QLNNDEDSNVTCTTVSGLPEIPGLGNLLNEIPNIPTETSVPVKHVDSFWVNLAEAVGQTLFFGFLAYVIASLLPQHMARIEDTMRSNPVASGGIGLLTSVAVPILIVLLALISSVLVIICIGILGFPIVLAMALALVAASFLGWVTVGNLVGVWAAAKLNLENRNLKTTAVLGTMLLTFVFGMLGAVPWVMGEGIVSFFAMCMGLGAVALTKFGTRAYPLVAVAEPDDDKITAVLNTLPDDEEPAE